MPDSVLWVNWDTGHMDLDMSMFFPCSQKLLKQMLKIIREDWEHSDELYDQVIEYQKFQIANIRAELETNSSNSKAKTSMKRWEGLLNTTVKFRR